MVKRLFHIANLLLITLAVYAGVKVFYQFVEMKLDRFSLAPPAPADAAATAAAVPQSSAPADGYEVIARRDLFKTTREAAAPRPEPKVDIAKLQKTDLNLKLWGTVATEERRSDLARAVIERSKTRDQHLYKVGDTIENATIAEIRRKSVILDVNGRKEKLVVEEKLPSTAESPATPERDAGSLKPVLPTGAQIALERSQVQNAFNNLTQLMSEVKIRPHFQDGKPAGFVVANIAPDSVIREMGLKSGDIINSINGREIKSVDDAMAFYEQLQAGERLSIQLTRRGRPQTIEYTIEDEEVGGR